MQNISGLVLQRMAPVHIAMKEQPPLEETTSAIPGDLSLGDIAKIAREHVMVPRERREQRISLVYGMRSSRSTLTKDAVRRTMEEMGQ